MTSEIELQVALTELVMTLTTILKIVQPLIQQATNEELEKGIKL